MKLISKQLLREIIKNKIYVVIMFLSVVFTSSMYYFVHFSTDGNLMQLGALPVLRENQILFQNGMHSNTILARNGLFVLTTLTCLVFVLFFYHFFKHNTRQLGCIKALGYGDRKLCGFFVIYVGGLSFLGAVVGYVLGYFLSSILIEANIETYQVSGLIREINTGNILMGFFVPLVALSLSTYFSYGMIRGRQTALMIYGIGPRVSGKVTSAFADRIAALAPPALRRPLRLTLRKPIAVFLIAVSVTCFLVMILLGYSLTLSGQMVLESQTEGHHYLYETQFDTPQHIQTADSDALFYLHREGDIYLEDKPELQDKGLRRTIASFSGNESLFTLMDRRKNTIPYPKRGEMVIGQELWETHGYEVGDKVTVGMGVRERTFTVSAIAFNARSNWVYISMDSLSDLLSLREDACTGILSLEKEFTDGTVTTNEEKLDSLMRGNVSDKSSAVINQVIGCLIGCMLLYLALLLNFSDSTRDILIMHLMGYREREIRELLINIYIPIIWFFFIITLYPSIWIVKGVLKMLSIQIGDYFPFQTNAFAIIATFLLLNIFYYIVQLTFGFGIKRIIKKEHTIEYTN